MKIEVIKGKEFVYRAMLATKNKKPIAGRTISDELWFKMLRAKHSCIEEYEIWIEDYVCERVHTHIVRHKEIGKYISTSRKDFGGQVITDENGQQIRFIALRINAKRLIEISEQRLCRAAALETRILWEEVVSNIPDNILKSLCTEPCVRYACCISDKKCEFNKTNYYNEKRLFFELKKEPQ